MDRLIPFAPLWSPTLFFYVVGAVSYSGQIESDRVTRCQEKLQTGVSEPKKDEKGERENDFNWVRNHSTLKSE